MTIFIHQGYGIEARVGKSSWKPENTGSVCRNLLKKHFLAALIWEFFQLVLGGEHVQQGKVYKETHMENTLWKEVVRVFCTEVFVQMKSVLAAVDGAYCMNSVLKFVVKDEIRWPKQHNTSFFVLVGYVIAFG